VQQLLSGALYEWKGTNQFTGRRPEKSPVRECQTFTRHAEFGLSYMADISKSIAPTFWTKTYKKGGSRSLILSGRTNERGRTSNIRKREEMLVARYRYVLNALYVWS
jgi:hypothetical protein